MSTTPRFLKKLQAQNVLILGGTSGVGLATATSLVEQGANIIISSSRQAKLEDALTTLQTQYPSANVAGFVCNLAGPEIESNLQNLATQVSTHLAGQKLDHFIFTAGDNLPTVPIEEVTLEKLHAALHVRAAGTFLAVKTFHPFLHKANTSSIVLTTGSIHRKPIPGGWSILSFIGAGLTGLTRQLAFDLGPVRVNCVAPGVVATDLWSDMDESARDAMFAHLEKTLPTGRVPVADDLAECYSYLLRDRNVTGSVVDSNGGAFVI